MQAATQCVLSHLLLLGPSSFHRPHNERHTLFACLHRLLSIVLTRMCKALHTQVLTTRHEPQLFSL